MSAETNDAGLYEIHDIPPGSNYRLQATRPGYRSRFNDGGLQVSETQPISLGGHRFRKDLTLSPQGDITAITPQGKLQTKLDIPGNYPNPFTSTTSIPFLPVASHVDIKIYDALGRHVATLLRRDLAAGRHSVQWHPSQTADGHFPSGVYFYHITTERENAVGMMTIVH